MEEALRYPRYDLPASIEAARGLQERGGGVASANELASYLGYSGTNNGAFLNRIAAAKLFGLIEGQKAALRITRRGLNILHPDYEATLMRAKVDAFLSVPLYKAFLDEYEGKALPSEEGMLNVLQSRYGVSPSRAQATLTNLLDSAEEAGLFSVAGARTKMVRSTAALTLGERLQPALPDAPDAKVSDRSEAPAGGYPKILEAALDELPTSGTWDEDQLSEWLDWFEGALRVHYKLPRPRNGAGHGRPKPDHPASGVGGE